MNNNIDLGKDITHDLEERFYPGIGSQISQYPVTPDEAFTYTSLTAEKLDNMLEAMFDVKDKIKRDISIICTHKTLRTLKFQLLGFNTNRIEFNKLSGQRKKNVIHTLNRIYKRKTYGKKFNIRRVQSWN